MINIIDWRGEDPQLIYQIFTHFERELAVRKTRISVLQVEEVAKAEGENCTVRGNITRTTGHSNAFSSSGENTYLIKIKRGMSAMQLVTTIAHEMFHAYQYERNLHGINDKEERKKPYRDREYEVEARNYEGNIKFADVLLECSNRVIWSLRRKK